MITLAKSFSLQEAARRLPPGRNGRPVSTATLVRWIIHGVWGPDDEIVRLVAVRLGSRWVTDEQALQLFVESLTPNPVGSLPSPPRMARRRASEQAEHGLDERGF